MRFQKIEESGANQTRYVFSITLDEAKLILGLLNKSRKYIPKCEMTEMLNSRISEMIKSIVFGLYAGDKFGKKFVNKDNVVYES